MAHKRVTIPAAIVAAYKSGDSAVEYPHLKSKFDAAVKTKDPKLTLDIQTTIELLDTFREGKLYEAAKETVEGFLSEGTLDPAEKAAAEALLNIPDVKNKQIQLYADVLDQAGALPDVDKDDFGEPDVKVLSSTTWEMYHGESDTRDNSEVPPLPAAAPRYIGTRQARRLASRLANRVGMTQYDPGRRVRKESERAKKRVEAGRWAGVGDQRQQRA